MKKSLLMITVALLAFPVFARDFSYTHEGQTLIYTVIDEDAKTCMTKAGAELDGNIVAGNEVAGELVIPSTASDGADMYSVTKIGQYAFVECSGLTSINIPESVTAIGYFAFYRDTYLKKVQFASIEALCRMEFEDLQANPLHYGHRIYIDGEEVTEVIVPEGVTALNYTFSSCVNLTSVIIPEGVSEIGNYTFYNCFVLPSINIPESVTTIGLAAFRNCESLTTVTIPKGITTIGKVAFSGCTHLESVYYGSDNLVEGDPNIFSEKTYQNATLYVAENNVLQSGSKDPWKNFAKIKEYDFSGIEEPVADIDENASCEVFDISGVKVGGSLDGLAGGLYIVRRGDNARKISVK